jgi:hypothetical protein
MTISNLTDLSMHFTYISFDTLEILISKIYSKLKILRLSIKSYYKEFIDTHQWEQLILRYLPGLEKFYLKCTILFCKILPSQTYSEL